MEWERFLNGEQYNETWMKTSVFVSHAGIGNIISAREQQTPIIVMNRQFKRASIETIIRLMVLSGWEIWMAFIRQVPRRN